MERKEFPIQMDVNTTPPEVDMDVSVDVSNINFESLKAGETSQIFSKIISVTGPGEVALSIGTTDWVGTENVMAGSITEVLIRSGEYIPLIVAGEAALGSFSAGTYAINFKVTPPVDIDLNDYTQTIVIIAEQV